MRGVNIVDECSREQMGRGGVLSKSSVSRFAERRLESIGLDGPRLAAALIFRATEDARQNPYGRGDNERVGQDKERIIELIAEAQWFLLDDDDEDFPCGFHWSCYVLGLEWTFLRRKVFALLREEKTLIPRRERHRLAALAASRRIKKPAEVKNVPRQCAGPGCVRSTRSALCNWCLAKADVVSSGTRLVSCSKCGKEVVAPLAYMRRPYCLKCEKRCVREGCFNLRRPGATVTVCGEHHRIERRVGHLGNKIGVLYYPKFGPEDLFDIAK